MKINILGDSITAGAWATDEEHMFTNVLAQKLGCTINNYGVGGSRIAEQNVREKDWDEYSFNSRADDMEKDADFVFVFGGTNDYGHGDADFGDLDEHDDIYTFYGALHTLCKKLLANWRSEQVCFILPLWRYNEHVSCPEGNCTDHPGLERYRQAIKQVCAFYRIVCLDLRSSFPRPTSNQPGEFYHDGLHPTNKGHQIIADRIEDYLNKRFFEPEIQYIKL